MKHESSPTVGAKAADTTTLDSLTGGAFTAPTTGERAARLRDWLATDPSVEVMADVFRELSHRDRGAAKVLKEKLDDIKRQKSQEAIAAEWADKATRLLEQVRLNVADAMGWQRDAARAGAPLSREPLAGLRAALSDRVKALDDLQHRVQVAREAAVLLAQRIEVLSTKPLADSVQTSASLGQDVARWQDEAAVLATEGPWESLDARFHTMIQSSTAQLQLVWQAFEAALAQAVAAAADPTAPLPSVPVWADEIRVGRGESVDVAQGVGKPDADAEAAKVAAGARVRDLLSLLAEALAQGPGKVRPRAVSDLRQLLKNQGRWLDADLVQEVKTSLTHWDELEGGQKLKVDHVREELLAKAEQLLVIPDAQRPGGRKLQEILRGLREQWKQADQGAAPNHAMWKRFDEACTRVHKLVEQWLDKVKAESATHRAERLALVTEVQSWAEAHAAGTDWKAQARDLSRFADAWRNGGHLGEKQFAELQPMWKAVMAAARGPLEAEQAASLARREALIQQAEALGAAPALRMDAVRGLQQAWQHEAQAVPMDRRHEQKLWDAFRKPLDEAFARKSSLRDQPTAALNAHEQRVVDLSQALQVANDSHDAQQIQAAMAALADALQNPDVVAAVAQTPSVQGDDAQSSDGSSDVSSAAEAAPAAPARKIVAVRGDDRPGMKRAEPAAPTRGGKPGDRRDAMPSERRGGRPVDAYGAGDGRAHRGADRGPRLGDQAFRAQRDAMEHAQLNLKRLASQAHGQALTHLLDAWKARDAAAVPTGADLGPRVTTSTRSLWVQALSVNEASAESSALLRLEMAAEVPTPAVHLNARRALQLHLLTRRNDPTPAQTWGKDVADALSAGWSDESALRLQQALKVLLRRV